MIALFDVSRFQKSAAQFRHALRVAIDNHPLGPDAPVVETLRMASAVQKDASVRSRMVALMREADRAEKAAEIPEGFVDAVKFGLKRRGKQVGDMIHELKLPESVAKWFRPSGGPTPQRFVGFSIVARIEAYLMFEAGELWSRVKHRSIGAPPPSSLHPSIPRGKRLPWRPHFLLLLPDELLTKSEEEQHRITLETYDKARRSYESHHDAHHAVRCSQPYQHKRRNWGRRLEEEYTALCERHQQDQPIGPDQPHVPSTWADATAFGHVLHRVERTMGAVLKVHPELQLADATLALFACVHYVWETIEYVRMRRPENKMGRHPYSESDLGILSTAICLVQKGGFLRLDEAYHERMPAEAMRVCRKAFPQARSWQELCAAAELRYMELKSSVRLKIKEDADETIARPKQKLLPVMVGDTPEYVEQMSRAGRAALEQSVPGSSLRDYALRGLIDREFGDLVPNRGRTVREMTWRPDGTGMLRFEAGKWSVQLPKKLFKNWRALVFRDVETVPWEIEDVAGLYGYLSEYLEPGGTRDRILNGRVSDAFLVKNSDEPKLEPRDLLRIVHRDTLVANAGVTDPSFENMRSYGPHARRKIKYQSVRRTKGDAVAAGTLVIGQRTADLHYGFNDPSRLLAEGVLDRKHEHDRRKP